MARRDILRSITEANSNATDGRVSTGYAVRGASRSMVTSIGELAAQAAKAESLLQGEVVVEIEPALLDASFITDRMEFDDEVFQDLVKAMSERGQDSPILVRPHPINAGRYQIVFGHRRARAAAALGRPVRAIVKPLTDKDHVIAQGQENSARADLSFIERALFAQRLTALGHDRETVQSALAIDAPMLSRMLSVTGRIPQTVLEAIGPARGVGRDRWLELMALAEKPANADKAAALLSELDFQALPSDARFAHLFDLLKRTHRTKRRPRQTPPPTSWKTADDLLSVTATTRANAFLLDLKAPDAPEFGSYLSERVEGLYRAFRQSKLAATGD